MQVNSNYNELKIKARQANLLTYLESIGYTFKREGKHYRCLKHTSLVITPPNAFYWNSKGIGGNSIDFLVKCLGKSFKEAVEELTNKNLKQQKSHPQAPPEDDYIINNTYLNRAYGYLIQNRGIQHDIIANLVKKGYIDMLNEGPYKHPIIGFKILNEHKEATGYEVQGTFNNVRFKGVTSDTKYGYGFNIIIGQPKKAIFFESAIDLISFIQLSKIKKLDIDISNSILISLAGLKESTLKHSLKAFQISSKPILAVDNDNASKEFKELLNRQAITFKEIVPHSNYKDWNEMLMEVRNDTKNEDDL